MEEETIASLMNQLSKLGLLQWFHWRIFITGRLFRGQIRHEYGNLALDPCRDHLRCHSGLSFIMATPQLLANTPSLPWASCFDTFCKVVKESTVTPGLEKLHVWWNLKTKECPGRRNLAGLPWSYLLSRIDCTLDRGVAFGLTAIWGTPLESYLAGKWSSRFWHRFRWWRGRKHRFPANYLSFHIAFFFVPLTQRLGPSAIPEIKEVAVGAIIKTWWTHTAVPSWMPFLWYNICSSNGDETTMMKIVL